MMSQSIIGGNRFCLIPMWRYYLVCFILLPTLCLTYGAFACVFALPVFPILRNLWLFVNRPVLQLANAGLIPDAWGITPEGWPYGNDFHLIALHFTYWVVLSCLLLLCVWLVTFSFTRSLSIPKTTAESATALFHFLPIVLVIGVSHLIHLDIPNGKYPVLSISGISANEGNVVQLLRMYCKAQEEYFAFEYSKLNGNAEKLYAVPDNNHNLGYRALGGELAHIDREGNKLTLLPQPFADATLKNGGYQGYYFLDVKVEDARESYSLVAIPLHITTYSMHVYLVRNGKIWKTFIPDSKGVRGVEWINTETWSPVY